MLTDRGQAHHLSEARRDTQQLAAPNRLRVSPAGGWDKKLSRESYGGTERSIEIDEMRQRN